jgi:hypothetical protein
VITADRKRFPLGSVYFFPQAVQQRAVNKIPV